jgi:hypothetical protein
MMSLSKKDLGVVIQTYLDLDRESSASELRARVLAAGLTPQKEYEGLLRIEAALALATRERLDGKPGDVQQILKTVAGVMAPA